MSFKTVRLIIPFLYDLGGSIKDDTEVIHLFKKKYPSLEVDSRDLFHYNLSHLSVRKSTYTLQVEDIEINIGDSFYSFKREIKIFPQGVLSISYSIVFKDITSTEILAFFDNFYEEKNLDYFHHLKVSKSIKNSLKNSPKVREICHELENQGNQNFKINNFDIYSQVSGIIAEELDMREAKYNFHDFRLIIIIEDNGFIKNIRRKKNLIELIKLYEMNDQLKFVSEKKKEVLLNSNSLLSDNTILWAGTWTSIFLTDDEEKLNPYLSLFNVAHYYWYICQTWLFVLNTILEKYKVNIDKRTLNRIELLEKVHQISLHRVNISNTLLEVSNIDIMLKNSQLSDVMKEYYDKFGIEKHLGILQSQMDILFGYYQIEIDRINQQFAIFSQKQTQSLQILFAISMGAGIASLIPSICNLPGRHLSIIDVLREPLAIATFSALLIIWVVYFMIVYFNRYKIKKIRKTNKRKRRQRYKKGQASKLPLFLPSE